MLLGIRSAPKEDAGRSAAEVALGAPFALPGQLVDPAGAAPSAADMTAIPMRQQSYAEVTRAGSGLLDDASWVYVRRGASSGPLEPAYAGPHLVLQRSDKVFISDFRLAAERRWYRMTTSSHIQVLH